MFKFVLLILSLLVSDLFSYDPLSAVYEMQKKQGVNLKSPLGDTVVNRMKYPKRYDPSQIKEDQLKILADMVETPIYKPDLSKQGMDYLINNTAKYTEEVIEYFYNWAFIESNWVDKVTRNNLREIKNSAFLFSFVTVNIERLPFERRDLKSKVKAIFECKLKVYELMLEQEIKHNTDFVQSCRNSISNIKKQIKILNGEY